MSGTKLTIQRICRVAVLAGLYFALNLVAIKAGNLRITFASLPVVLGALLLGPIEGVLAAGLGELLNQLLTYGVSPTLVLWLIPPMLRAVPIGLLAKKYAKTEKPLQQRPAEFYAVCIASALLVTAANTGVIWLDSVIMGYFSYAYVFGSAALRFVTGILTAAVVATVSLPVGRILSGHLGGR